MHKDTYVFLLKASQFLFCSAESRVPPAHSALKLLHLWAHRQFYNTINICQPYQSSEFIELFVYFTLFSINQYEMVQKHKQNNKSTKRWWKLCLPSSYLVTAFQPAQQTDALESWVGCFGNSFFLSSYPCFGLLQHWADWMLLQPNMQPHAFTGTQKNQRVAMVINCLGHSKQAQRKSSSRGQQLGTTRGCLEQVDLPFLEKIQN